VSGPFGRPGGARRWRLVWARGGVGAVTRDVVIVAVVLVVVRVVVGAVGGVVVVRFSIIGPEAYLSRNAP
jgi:molybdopterin biosynthesis enzyme MoaB